VFNVILVSRYTYRVFNVILVSRYTYRVFIVTEHKLDYREMLPLS